MCTVRTEAELKAAFAAKEKKIVVVGQMAEDMVNKSKRKKKAKAVGIAVALASLAAVPFTLGASAVGAAVGMGLTIGSITISTTELALLCGTAVAIYGIHKASKVTFKVNEKGEPEVVIEPNYKD
ncbi:MAG: hypothetical protein J6O49_18935 [Bacteroidaceae bacterium]|nr:hypothetical protein [Bacteroidaceae bacterium]